MQVAILRTNPAATAALAIAAAAVATILGAYYFQYVLGYAPCPLCLEQRIPYYLAIPLAGVVAAVAAATSWRNLALAGLGLLAIAMLVSAGLGLYHAGVEWKWWTGPQDCSAPLAPLGSPGGLMDQLRDSRVVRCDEAAWRFLGLSLAGWNVLISLALVGIALWGMRGLRRLDR